MPQCVLFAWVVLLAVAPPAADDLPLRPIPGPEAPPPETPWLAYAALAASIAPAILLLTILIRWLCRPRDASPSAPPQWALRELDRIAQRPADNRPESPREIVEAGTNVLRIYLHSQFQLPASEQTTQEFRRVLEERQTFTPEQRGRLGELLTRADLVKFAQVAMSIGEVQGYLKAVRAFVEETGVANPQTQIHSR